ncbi:MAG TPA: PAS domain S-box protein [Verrucomicrobiae bacterium]|jgi:PAS domain S-box-containing protein|nr:PAS domain S-box protein [Verrucomicrobiae bacterium]
MEKPLRILHLEDDPDFVSLVSDMLKGEGLSAEMTSTQNFPDFMAALRDNSFDIILADYSLPTCNGLQALNAVRETDANIPFVLISGTIGEHAAIECLRCGATDYVLKNKLERLAPAVRRAVQEAQEREHRKRAETELVRREKYFRTLTEHSLDVLTILDAEGLFQFNSPSLKTVLGYEPGDVAGQSAFALTHPEDLPGVLAAFQRALDHPGEVITHEFRCRHQDGSWRHLEIVGQNQLADPEIAGVVLNARDISDRKRAEAEQREGEKQYRLIFEGSPTPMWVTDVDTFHFLEVNDAAVHHYGYSREEFLSMTSRDIRSSGETERFVKYINEVMKKYPESGIGRAGLWRHQKKNGENIDVEIKWSKITFRGRAAVLIMAHDITERKRAAEALEKSEASLAAAQRIAHLGSWELDLKDLKNMSVNDLRWSDETYRIFGYEPQQVPVNPDFFYHAVHPDDRQRVSTAITEALQKKDIYDVEYRISLPAGEERYVRERAEPVMDSSGTPVQMRGIVMDITERRQLGEQLRQSQKMEAIGQLAGGVAHDFNNILTVIHGHASLLLADRTVTKNAARSAQQITQAAERAAGLTRQLLTFSRRQVMQPRRLDLNEVVSNMNMMLGRILGEDIVLQLNYWPEPAFIKADASMMEQVLLNLVVNARDAMPRGGQLAIKITSVQLGPNPRPYRSESRAGEFVCLTVTDTGSGIDPENLRRIFEPFFTTKEVGKGTGLGLATVYGIINQHQGWIDVDSEIGKGSTFRVFLPLARDAAPAREEKATPDAVRGGKETILVVEDEVAVRELVCRVLGSHGYKILEAETGVKALEVWERNKKKIDLLLTDLVMPDRLNGRELAEKLRADRPRLKVIFTSGYSADVVGKDFVLQRDLRYLQKPYDPQKLAVTVRDCLDGNAG